MDGMLEHSNSMKSISMEPTTKTSTIVVGLGFGDEGKGSIVDALTHKNGIHDIIRFNGGAQAAHHVVVDEHTWHCFSQFASGSFHPNVRTWLSEFMLVDPMALIAEEKALRSKGLINAFQRLCVHIDCVVVTPFHKSLNRLQERLLNDNKHGSCGMGVGWAWRYHLNPHKPTLYWKDLFHRSEMRTKLNWIKSEIIDHAEQMMEKSVVDAQAQQEYVQICQMDVPSIVQAYHDFATTVPILQFTSDDMNTLLQEKSVIFEGAQGMLLDPMLGFAPHVTKTRTTPHNALQLIERADVEQPEIVGVTRGYMTRHGRGPFPSEWTDVENLLPEEHNPSNIWQGSMRMGWLDLVLLEYACAQLPARSSIAVTHLDRLQRLSKKFLCVGYEKEEGIPVHSLHSIKDSIDAYRPILKEVENIQEICSFLPRPVSIQSFGPSYTDKLYL